MLMRSARVDSFHRFGTELVFHPRGRSSGSSLLPPPPAPKAKAKSKAKAKGPAGPEEEPAARPAPYPVPSDRNGGRRGPMIFFAWKVWPGLLAHILQEQVQGRGGGNRAIFQSATFEPATAGGQNPPPPGGSLK